MVSVEIGSGSLYCLPLMNPMSGKSLSLLSTYKIIVSFSGQLSVREKDSKNSPPLTLNTGFAVFGCLSKIYFKYKIPLPK